MCEGAGLVSGCRFEVGELDLGADEFEQAGADDEHRPGNEGALVCRVDGRRVGDESVPGVKDQFAVADHADLRIGENGEGSGDGFLSAAECEQFAAPLSAEERHVIDNAEAVALGVQLDDEVVGVEIDPFENLNEGADVEAAVGKSFYVGTRKISPDFRFEFKCGGFGDGHIQVVPIIRKITNVPHQLGPELSVEGMDDNRDSHALIIAHSASFRQR